MFDPRPIKLTVNGRAIEATVDSRVHLADFLRKDLALTGTHLGCEHGVCGACTVKLKEGVTTLAPLPKKALVRDLVTEIAPPNERLHGRG